MNDSPTPAELEKLVERLNTASADKALAIGEAWNLLEESAAALVALAKERDEERAMRQDAERRNVELRESCALYDHRRKAAEQELESLRPAAESLGALEEWLRASPDGMDGKGHRATINVSISPWLFTVRLEVGDFGHGACVELQREETIAAAIRAALAKARAT